MAGPFAFLDRKPVLRERAVRWLLGAVVAGALAGAIALAWTLERQQREAPVQGNAIVYLPPAELARLASLGHPTLMADYYWMQALQYYGEDKNRRYHYRDLYRFIDLVVTLDPNFKYAYFFGGTAIPYNPGGWKWQNRAQAEDILLRGLERFPDDYRLWMQLGFVRGVIGTDLKGAAEAYRRGAEAPGAPPWIPKLVTRLLATAGELDRARAYAESFLEHAETPEMRLAMERRLAEIDVEATLRTLDRAIARYRERFGHDPDDVQALVDAGIIDRVPVEPLGGEYRIEAGRAISTSLHKGRLQIFREENEHPE